MRRILPVALGLLAAGCSYVPNLTPHRIEIQQGNFITQEMVAQLKPGMTRDQVRFALGTPLVSDPFHGDRWDYIFVRQRANRPEVERRRISVFFEADKLVRTEGDVVAAGAPAPSPPRGDGKP